MSTWNEKEDGMGCAGLVPTRAERDAERERDRALTHAYAEGRKDEREEFSALLPGSYYMDPPDGGSVTVLEQFKRMARDARMWREHQERARLAVACELRCEG